MAATSAPTRDRLLDAALEIVRAEGYAGASVGAIAVRAGVASGTLYRHFPSKGELFTEVFRRACNRELAALREADSGATAPAPERMSAVIEAFARRALRAPRIAWALLAEPVDPLVDAERLAYRRAYRAHLAEIVDAGVGAGTFPEQDAELAAAALVGGIGEALVGPLSPVAAEPDADALIRALQLFTLRALGA